MQAIKIYCSYAYTSREDKKFLYALENHLANLKNLGQIEIWHNDKLPPGADVAHETLTQLKKADIILLFISSDYMSSSQCYNVEVMHAVELADAEIAYVRVILVRPVDWENAPFHWCQALPSNGKFVSSWPNRHDAFVNIVEGIKEVVREARASRSVRETKRVSFGPTLNTTHVITTMPPLAALKVQRQTDEAKPSRQTDEIKRNRQTDELQQKKQPARIKANKQVFVDEAIPSEFTPPPQKKAMPRTRRKQRRTRAQNPPSLRSTDITKWRNQAAEEFKRVSRGKYGIFPLLAFICDVAVLPISIQKWPTVWWLPWLTCLISLPIFAWGTVNTDNRWAMLLALLYGGIWWVIIQHNVSWQIPYTIGLSSLIACLHFLLFQGHRR